MRRRRSSGSGGGGGPTRSRGGGAPRGRGGAGCCSFCCASSFFFSSSSLRGMPMGRSWASNSIVHSSAANSAAGASPKKAPKSIWATRGLTSGVLPSMGSGKNKLTAVEATISSSNPSICSILASTQGCKTDLLTLATSKGVLKLVGKVVDFKALARARLSSTEAEPLMAGMIEATERCRRQGRKPSRNGTTLCRSAAQLR